MPSRRSVRGLVARLRDRTVLVVGDILADEYIFTSPARISREVPVLIVTHERELTVPGGAANVANDVATLGGWAVLTGVAGAGELETPRSPLWGACSGSAAACSISRVTPPCGRRRNLRWAALSTWRSNPSTAS